MSFESELQHAVNQLEKVRRIPEEKKREILEEAGKLFIASAQSFAPRDTGLLKRSIKSLRIRKKKDIVVIGPKKLTGRKRRATALGFYAHFVEFGTIRNGKQTKAQPFMRPAWESQKGPAAALIAKRLREQFVKFE